MCMAAYINKSTTIAAGRYSTTCTAPSQSPNTASDRPDTLLHTTATEKLSIPNNTAEIPEATADGAAVQNAAQFTRVGLGSHVSIIRLKNALHVFRSVYGKDGRVLFLRNSTERGHVMVSSSSHRIIPFLRAEEPLLRLVFRAMEERGRLTPDHGLLCAIVCLRLALSCTGLSVSHNTAREHQVSANMREASPELHKFTQTPSNELATYKQIVSQRVPDVLNELCEHLVSWLSACHVRVEIDGSSVQPLLSLCRSVISPASRAACLHDVEAVVCTVTQAFIHSLPCESRRSPTSITSLCIEDTKCSARAQFLRGLLLDTAGCSASHLRLIKGWVERITCVLVTCSMSGDTDESYDVTLHVASVSRSSRDDALTYAACKRLVTTLANRSVTLLLCQKVVHSGIKRLAASLGVAVIDRLGSVVAEVLCSCGVKPVRSVSSVLTTADLSESQLLHTTVELRHYKHRAHVLLGVSAASLVLHAPTDEALHEFQDVCERAAEALRLTLRDGWALCGGGCWQAAVASHLRQLDGREWDASITQCMSRAFLNLGIADHLDFSDHPPDITADGDIAWSPHQTSQDDSTEALSHVIPNKNTSCPSEGLRLSKCRHQRVTPSSNQIPLIIDCADSVISALRCATNTASMLLSIDTVLVESS